MQKTLVKCMHRKIVSVKVEPLKYLKWILLESIGTVNQTTSCQHTLSKKLVQHIGEVQSC